MNFLLLRTWLNRLKKRAALRKRQLTRSCVFWDVNYPSHQDLSKTQKISVFKFNERLLAEEIPIESHPCLCGSRRHAFIGGVDRFRIRQTTIICRNCGLIRSEPRLASDFLEEFYRSDAYRTLYTKGFNKAQVFAQFKERAEQCEVKFKFTQEYTNLTRESRILEVGCGAGCNLYPYHHRGMEVLGVDWGEIGVQVGQEKGLNLIVGSIEQVPDDARFDLIILSHVLEHWAQPVHTIRRLLKYLSPEGLLYIELPDMEYFSINQLQNVHLYYFTDRTLTHYLRYAGLFPVAVKKQIVGNHMCSLWRRCNNNDKKQPFSGKHEYLRMRTLILNYDQSLPV